MSDLAENVRAAIDAGDPAAVRDLVVAATEKERREIRSVVDESWWHEYGSPKRFARMLARFGSATARQVASEWWSIDLNDESFRDLAYTVLAARGRDFFETVARNIVDDGVQQGALLVRRAVQQGFIDAPPDHEAYVRGLVVQLGDWNVSDSTYAALRADPTLLDEVWQIFEVDCSTELWNSAAWVTNELGVLTGGRESNRWLVALPRLADERLLDRDRLLDASLEALLRDFRPSMVGWYAKLHEELAPNDDERRARTDRYLALLASPTPSVVKEGLVGLKAVEGAVPADELARASTGPLSQKQKNLAVETLALLGRAAEREPGERPTLLEAAALSLGHERADVQERGLTLLERYPDEAPRGALLGFAEVVSPTLRTRVEALTGIVAEAPEPETVAVEPSPRVDAVSTAEPVALQPVESVDELIELAASLLEGQGNGDDVERLVDGVSRLCGERPRGFERRVSGLAKRADQGGEWGLLSGVGLVQSVVLSWTTGKRPPSYQLPDTLLGFLGQRALEVASRAAKRNPRELLALPTHAGGWIESDVLAEREQRAGRLRNRPDPADRLQAKLRVLRDVTAIAYSPSVVEQKRWNQEERFLDLEPASVPRDFGPLAPAVAAVGRSHGGSIWLDPVAWGAWDALGARWCLTILPTHPEIAFAGAARLIVDRLDAAPQLYPDVVLERALDSHLRLEGVAWLAVAGGLLSKSPDLQRIATDVLVTSIEDGRFDPDALAGALAWLFASGFAKASRLEAPFRDAGRISNLHAAELVRLGEALLTRLTQTPHGLQAPLQAVLEHAARTGLSIERPDARSALERIAAEVSRSSKLGRLARSLLDLSRTG
jgi:hypothetical protein